MTIGPKVSGACLPEIEEPAGSSKLHTGEPHAPSVTKRPTEFANTQKLNEHYEKHGSEFKVESSHEYLVTAQRVVNESMPVNYLYRNAPTTGYVLLMGTNRSGQAKFAFAGTNTNGHDEDIHYEYPEYNEHFIKLKVERIDVSFH